MSSSRISLAAAVSSSNTTPSGRGVPATWRTVARDGAVTAAPPAPGAGRARHEGTAGPVQQAGQDSPRLVQPAPQSLPRQVAAFPVTQPDSTRAHQPPATTVGR